MSAFQYVEEFLAAAEDSRKRIQMTPNEIELVEHLKTLMRRHDVDELDAANELLRLKKEVKISTFERRTVESGTFIYIWVIQMIPEYYLTFADALRITLQRLQSSPANR